MSWEVYWDSPGPSSAWWLTGSLRGLRKLVYLSGLLQWEVKVKVTQLCPTLCDPMDYTVHGIVQARILEWVAFPFSRGPSQPRAQTQVSHIAGGFFTSWATREAQEYQSGYSSPVDLPFLVQELNQGLLNCRWILYQLSYQWSPSIREAFSRGGN